jgi:hypothetical protein
MELRQGNPAVAVQPERRSFVDWVMTKRWALLGISLLLATIIVIQWRQDREMEEQIQKSAIHPWQVQLEEVSLNRISAVSELKGKIRNNSSSTLAGVNFNLTVQDCVRDKCETVGEQTVYVDDLTIPPNQTRAFTRFVRFVGLPAPEGEYKWQYSVGALQGKR